jgi:hypothetical protein
MLSLVYNVTQTILLNSKYFKTITTTVFALQHNSNTPKMKIQKINQLLHTNIIFDPSIKIIR